MVFQRNLFPLKSTCYFDFDQRRSELHQESGISPAKKWGSVGCFPVTSNTWRLHQAKRWISPTWRWGFSRKWRVHPARRNISLKGGESLCWSLLWVARRAMQDADAQIWRATPILWWISMWKTDRQDMKVCLSWPPKWVKMGDFCNNFRWIPQPWMVSYQDWRDTPAKNHLLWSVGTWCWAILDLYFKDGRLTK